MTRALTSSAVFATWRSLHRLLGGLSWPAPPVGDSKVTVGLGTFTEPALEPVEWALVRCNLVDHSAGWATNTRKRDETFHTDIRVGTLLPARNTVEVLDRLEQLTTPVEQMFIVTAEGAQKPTELVNVIGRWQIVQFDPALYTLAEGGVGGAADIRVRVEARIGGMP